MEKPIDTRPTLIYALKDPRNGEIRYIGQTKCSLKKRLSEHTCAQDKSYRTNWIRSLLSNGINPIITLIQIVPYYDDWRVWEMFWIKLYRDLEYRLTNATNGGDGTVGWKPTEVNIENMRVSHIGKRLSASAKEKLSKSMLGVKKSEAHRKSISEARKNSNPEHNRKIGEPLKKTINQYSLDGQFIKTWGCAKDAENAGIGDARAIGQCARGTSRTSAGYIWKYVEEQS